MITSAIITAFFGTSIFGNYNNFYKWLTNNDSKKLIDQLTILFYNSFQNTIRKHQNSTSISHLLRLEKKKIIAFFEVEVEQDITFQELLSENMLTRFYEVLNDIIEDEVYKKSIEPDLAKELIKKSLLSFHEEVYRLLSEKQGIYIILQNIFAINEGFDELINRVEKQNNRFLLRIDDNKKEIIENANNNTAILQNLVSQLVSDNIRKEAKNVIIPIVKDRYEEAVESLEKFDYNTAINSLKKVLQYVEENDLEDNPMLFKALTNIAYCYEKLEKREDAANALIEALQYDPNNPKALLQGYFAYGIIQNINEQENIKNKIIHDHPETPEYLQLQLSLSDDSKEIEDVKNKIDANFQNSLELHYNLALAFYKKENIEAFREYMNKAISLNSKEANHLKLILAFNLSYPHVSRFYSYKKPKYSVQILNDLEEALSLYHEIWSQQEDFQFQKFHVKIPVNISTILFATDKCHEALQWIDKALVLESADFIRAHKIFYLKDIEKYDEALAECEKMNDITHQDMDYVFPIYVELLNNTGRVEEAIDIAYKFINECTSSTHHENVVYYLSQLLINNSKGDQAINIINKSIDEEKPNLRLLLARSKAFLSIAEEDIAMNELSSILVALNNQKEKKNEVLLCELGEYLFNLKRYEEVIPVLVLLNENEIEDYFLGILFDCYSFTEKHDEALALCERIRINRGVHLHLTKKEIMMLVSTRDYSTAIKISEEYLAIYTKDIDVRLRLCDLYIYSKKQDKALEIDLNFPLEKLNLFHIGFLVKNLVSLNQRQKAYLTIYELWKIKKSPELCEFILTSSLFLNMPKEDILIETISSPCAISLKYNDAEIEEDYIIIDNGKANFNNYKEIDSKHAWFEKLINKSINDEITITSPHPFPIEYRCKIVSIKRISQYIFLKAHDALATQFKGQSSTVAMKPKSPEIGVQQILKMATSLSNEGKYQERIENQNEILDRYCEYNIPIGGVQNTLGYPLMALWYSFSEDFKIGIKSSFGEKQEIINENNILKTSPNADFCVDITSILSLMHSGISKVLTQSLGKFHITQSLVDLIKEMLHKRESRFYVTQCIVRIPSLDDRNDLRHTISNERFSSFLDDLETIDQWVEEFCYPPEHTKLRLKIPNKKQKQMDFIFSETIFDSRLLSQEKDYILLTDCAINKFALWNEGVKSTQTATLFRYLRTSSENKEAYNHAVYSLIELNYRFIHFDVELLQFSIVENHRFSTILNYYLSPLYLQSENVFFIVYLMIKALWSGKSDTGLQSKRTIDILNFIENRVNTSKFYKQLTYRINAEGVNKYFPALKESIEKWWQIWCINNNK